jgi:thiol-disulfide isomerase/thioredoxin
VRSSRVGIIFVLLAQLVFFSHALHAAQLLSPVDRSLPEFDLASMNAEQWQASTLDGKIWVINFWATWCPPCVEEMPSMNEAWRALENQGVGMLAINAGEGRDAVEAFLKKIPIDFPILLGDGNSLANWSIRALPTTIVVNMKGEVVYEALGPREWNDEAMLAKILELRQ